MAATTGGRLSTGVAGTIACAMVALGIGAWTSFHYTFGAWRPDADIFVTVELWRGLHRHGLSFLPSWYYTQDNWLLSLLPICAVLYEMFGPRPALAVGVGWGLFIASVLMTGWLAARTSGWRAGLALASVLVFAGLPALGQTGYLSYPISHNVSMAWALLTLILAVAALERRSVLISLAAGAAVFANVLSDPWAAVAIACPLLAAAGGLAFLERRSPVGRAALGLAAACAIGLLAAETRGFGLFFFLPRSHLQFGDWASLLANLDWGSQALSGMFNIVPGAATGSAPVRVVNLTALAVLLGGAVLVGVLQWREAGLARRFVLVVAVLSIGATVLAFLVGRWPPGLPVGRFLPNVYFLGGWLVAAAAAGLSTRWPPRIGLGAYAGLFVAAGLLSGPQLWTQKIAPAGDPEAAALADLLRSHGLAYGYGPFWGAHALVMDSLTQGQVIIRPVTFREGRVARRPAETSSYWYRPGDQSTRRTFVVVRNDGEECPSVAACVDMAARQFGHPAETLREGDFTILVWPEPIVAGFAP